MTIVLYPTTTFTRTTAATTAPSIQSPREKDNTITMARTNVNELDTCLRRISKTETFLPSLRRLGPFAARRVAASSPPRPFLKLVNTGDVDVEQRDDLLGIDVQVARN